MCSLRDLLDNAGISKVVWVDDCHAQKIDEQIVIDIRARVAALTEKGVKPSHAVFATVDITAPESIRSVQIDKALLPVADSFPAILDSLVDDLGNEVVTDEEMADLTPGQVSVLLKTFPSVRSFSYAGWQKEFSATIANCDNATLFLIDREFTNEGQSGEAGDEIVASVVSAVPLAHCIMLTHTATQEETESLRLVVGEKVGLERHQFAVMSKRELGVHCNDAGGRLAQALKTVILYRFCYDLAKDTSQVMKNSLDNAMKDLVGLSIEEIDIAIFESSLDDGASEVDVITRILNLRQRTAVQDHLAGARSVFERLSRIRAVRACPLLKDEHDVGLKKGQSPVQDWRIDEVFDDGSRINRIHSPLCCGDIFEVTNSHQRFILLAQPCDITVRGTGNRIGRRRAEEAILVEIYREEEDWKPEQVYRIEGMEKDGRSWFVIFPTALSVNLHVLDLAVFNSEGKIEWDNEQERPKALLPGWQERYDKEKIAIATDPIPPEFAFLSLNPKIVKNPKLCKIHGTGRFRRIPMKRVGRIRSPYADAILASYSAYISRAAFDHNFARHLYDSDEPIVTGEHKTEPAEMQQEGATTCNPTPCE
jgi:hypothetical protein